MYYRYLNNMQRQQTSCSSYRTQLFKVNRYRFLIFYCLHSEINGIYSEKDLRDVSSISTETLESSVTEPDKLYKI